MKKARGAVMAWSGQVFENAKVRKGVLAAIAAVVAILYHYNYLFRELIAAEVLVGAGLAVFVVLVGIFYVAGVTTEWGLRWVEAGIRFRGESARRWYTLLSGTKKLADRRTKPVAY